MQNNDATRVRRSVVNPVPGYGEERMITHGVTIAFEHPTPEVSWKCADGADPEMFHPTDEAELAAAITFCADCPVRAMCLQLGLARQEFGVWGGVLLESGRRLEAVRKPGRPKVVRAA
jgi:WhiB family redox-sensing transcriptional regulator